MLAFGLTSRENSFSGAFYKSSHVDLGLGKGTSEVQRGDLARMLGTQRSENLGAESGGRTAYIGDRLYWM